MAGRTVRIAAATAAMVIVIAASSLLLSACGSSSSGEDVTFTGSAYPNVDTANTRHTSGPIDTGSAGELETAWTTPITGQSSFGSYAASPVVSKGVIYSQDLASNVEAIEQESGDVLWSKSYEQPSLGPNGVTVADDKVFGATPTATFALDQKTGKELWSTTLTRNEVEGIDIAPGYKNGIVYASTVPANATSLYEAGGVGTLWALDAKSGKKLWHFDTVPKDLWGEPSVNSGGGVWYTPAFDDKGFMYFGVGNPAPFPGTEKDPWGSSRPGANLYSNSIVKMDAKSGKMQWHFQLTPHDVYDWDLQGPPILIDSGGRELVVAAGKVGFVIALDSQTGELAWKRSVGKHNGHDEDNLYAMRGEFSKLKTPMTVYPGSLGGVIAPMSTDGKTVFAPIVNSPKTIVSQAQGQEGGPTTGELVALDVKTGAVRWKHEFSSPAFGATTSVNDLVFATTYDGKIHAFDAKNGRIVWQESLPAGTNAGVTVAGDTVIAPAGVAAAEGQLPEIVAYRLGG